MKIKSRPVCIAEYGSDYLVKKKVEEGKLYRVGKALYSESRYVPELAVIAYKYPKAVVTMETAFYIHGLTDLIPDIYDFATDRDGAKIRSSRVRQYFVPSLLFDKGSESVDYNGYTIRIYSRERMLVELLRYKNKLPYDYYKGVLREYRKIIDKLDLEALDECIQCAPRCNRIREMLQAEVL